MTTIFLINTSKELAREFKPKRNVEKKVNSSSSKVDEDKEERGGWRRIPEESELKGGIDIAIEHGDFSKCYLSAMDNGKFTLGARHVCHGEPPNPEEIFMLIKSPDDPKISLKTGFGKYVGFDAEAYLIATADAIGARERFDVVCQDIRTNVEKEGPTDWLSADDKRKGCRL
ncbi:hypothetical protein Mgra_00003682 [Meloidogyne graminicola]|uniref:Uncharacterized protein n=1 Tax=Meloidogyne graminicola TaxID=189291 RepID=A0A8S9ZTB7_9BILA|nr:hypothetical protein Mgra_00003682 [Meloidogyne graminicola]